MIETEVLIVGGGPGGSSCARRLRERGVDCRLVDQAAFPRTKLCAGWITPQVVDDLGLDSASYPHRWLTFDRLQIHLGPLHRALEGVQHSIRRYEFDAYLLEQSGVPVDQHKVRRIEPDEAGYVVDGHYRCRYLVGAGGTRCPVYRFAFREQRPRDEGLQAVTLEREYPVEWPDGTCHLWFFESGPNGYSWYVPKADGYLNLGTGAMAARLPRRGSGIRGRWRRLLANARIQTGLEEAPDHVEGYSYYLRPRRDGSLRRGNAFVVGDAAGLATRDLCEGIGPAVRSGFAVAEAIVAGGEPDLEAIPRHSAPGWIGGTLDRLFTRGH